MLVFFDILYMDGKSFLDTSYRQRRRILEQLVIVKSGYSILAERVKIDSGPNRMLSLERYFADCIAKHEGRRETLSWNKC